MTTYGELGPTFKSFLKTITRHAGAKRAHSPKHAAMLATNLYTASVAKLSLILMHHITRRILTCAGKSIDKQTPSTRFDPLSIGKAHLTLRGQLGATRAPTPAYRHLNHNTTLTSNIKSL